MSNRSLRPLLLPELLVFDATLAAPESKALALLFAGPGSLILQRRADKYLKAKHKPVSVSGMEDEESIEPPPPGLEYDDRDPCQLPGPGLELASEAGECVPPKDFAPAGSSVPFALGGENSLWPIETDNKRKVRVSYKDVRGKFHGKWGRHFGTLRKGKKGTRRHAGIDLFADVGDTVQAMEEGQVLAMLPFTAGTWAIYVLHDDHIVNYGELQKGSWKTFGVKTGQTVAKGQRLGTVGSTKMLHLETMKPETTIRQIRDGDLQWWRGSAAPEELLDPTQYLVRAERGWFERKLDEELEPPEGPAET